MLRRKGLLFCLVGPAGGGKTSLGGALLKQSSNSLVQSLSVTTRAMRAGETANQSYQFVSVPEFEKLIEAGYFFEWEKVHNNYYGTPQINIDSALQGESDLLLIIDIKGALNLKTRYPSDSVIIFLIPPSLETLRERILGRGSITPEVLNTRLETAKTEYSVLREAFNNKDNSIDYLVVNSDFEQSLRSLSAIIEAERSKLCRVQRIFLEELIK